MDFVVIQIKVERCADCPFVQEQELAYFCRKTEREVPPNVVATDCPERPVRPTNAELARYYSK